MVEDNMLETLSLEVDVEEDETEDSVGSEFQRVENVLVQPECATSTISTRQISQPSFKTRILCFQFFS